MLTLLCTAPNSSVGSPIEGANANSFSFSRVPPPPPHSSGACSSFAASAAAAGPSSSPTTPTRKLSLRRPSIRKRIQSLSRASGASLDKATSTLSNAASKSAFSFFRHASQGSNSSSGSSSLSSSAGNTSASASTSGSASGPTTGSGSAHTRGASTSSFASGKSSKSSSAVSSGHGRRLNILNISAPSAFKHQFHLGTNTRTSDGPWDDMRWRQVIQMRETDQDDTLVIDVVPPTASTVAAELPRKSTGSERNVSFSHTHSRSHSRTEQPSASLSSPNLLQIATSVSASSASSSSSSPASANSSTTPTPSSSIDTPSDESADKTKRQAKRASLVKRKPVPPLYPEEMEPMPTATSNPVRSSIPTQATYVLMPDPAPGQSHQVPETAPAGKTSFESREPEISREVAQKETLAKLERAATVKEKSKKDSTSISTTSTLTQLPVQNAPEHICILHSAPAPKPPPRRHTLAHMQARALGRGMCDAPSLPSVPVSEVKPTTSQEKEKERKKSRARPVPIVAPSPAPEIIDVETPVVTSATSPILPPGLPTVTRTGEEKDENPKEVQEEPTKRNEALPPIADNSPRPSLSSLASSSEGSETARSASSSSSSSSGELDLDLEPRTPTDERRVSAGSASSIKRLTTTPKSRDRSVRIVVSGGPPLGGDSGDEYEDGLDVETPRTLRRASKRPNPPARRVEANEESVYVTADEAEDM